MTFWQVFWEALNSPIVIAVLVSGILGLVGIWISNTLSNRRDLRSIQASVINRFSQAASAHLLNIETPNELTLVGDLKMSSCELRTSFNMALVLLPSKKTMTCSIEFLNITDKFYQDLFEGRAKDSRDLYQDPEYVKAQMLLGVILRDMCNQAGLPLKKFKYRFHDLYDAKDYPIQTKLIEEFKEKGWITD